jgi:hypothetical protein
MNIKCNSFRRYSGKRAPRCGCALCAIKWQIEELRRVTAQSVEVADSLADELGKIAKHISSGSTAG